MGIYHILPVGVSPGVVTSPLAYIKHQYDLNNVEFFGKDSNRQQVKKANDIIIFTTRAIIEGKTLEEGYVDNEIFKRPSSARPEGKDKIKVIDVVKRYIRREYGDMLKEQRSKLYWLESRPADFEYNIKQLLKAFYVLSPPGDVGREIWVNLTGGTNVINTALSMVTALSGITGRQYYTYVSRDDTKYLRPVEDSPDYWCNVPVMKVNFDPVYKLILEELKKVSEEAISDVELLGRIKSTDSYHLLLFKPEMDLVSFRRDFLNKLDGWLTERRDENNVVLSASGYQFLTWIEDPILKAFLLKEPLPEKLVKQKIFEEIPFS